MWDMITLQTIGTMVVCASVGIVLTRKIKMPHVALYIFTGLILGQVELAVMDKEILQESLGAVHIISKAGIALLLFLVGMELSLAKVKDIGKDALITGVCQVFISATLGVGISLVSGFSFIESFVLGIAMTFSSTVLVVKLLGEKKHLDALYGRISIGVLLVQDLVVILALTELYGLEGGVAMGPLQMGIAFLKALASVVILAATAWFISKKFLLKLMDWASSSAEILLIWSLSWCFLFVVCAHYLHLSPEIGAFLAGISLAQLPLSNSLKQRVHPLVNFFIGIFFIALGMKIDLATALESWKMALVFSVFVMIGKVFIFFIILKRQHFNERTSFVTGLTLAQISEFSFLFVALAFDVGLVGKDVVAIVAFTGLATFMMSSFIISNNERIYFTIKKKGLLARFHASQEKVPDEYLSRRRKDHIIVIGMNSLGREISKRLCASGHEVLSLDNDPKKLKGLPCDTLIGNAGYSSMLDEASFESAKLVVTTLRIEDVNNSLVYRCKKMGIPVAAHGFDSTVIPDLKRLNADYIIDSKSSWLKKLFNVLQSQGVKLP
ncbi:MAG: cation:proton antiporter [Bacteriovoracaceae bacterium]|nr:cation:proton antiporter [Bacteriovoracaceae bacterium]